MRHHLPQKVLHSKGGSHKDTLLCTPLLWDTPRGTARQAGGGPCGAGGGEEAAGGGVVALWVVVHVMVKCIERLYELWRVREMYTLTQVERHRALTTKFSKAWGD